MPRGFRRVLPPAALGLQPPMVGARQQSLWDSATADVGRQARRRSRPSPGLEPARLSSGGVTAHNPLATRAKVGVVSHPRPARDLVGLSRQVLYEFEMVEALAKRMVDLTLGGAQPEWQERFGTDDEPRRDWFEINAMLESLLIHARALTKFLFEPPPKASRGRAKPAKLADARAEDYFDDPLRDWRTPTGRGKRPKLLADANLRRISREVAHLTYERAGFVDRGSNWSPYAIYVAIADVVERFATKVDAARVVPDFQQRAAAAQPTRQLVRSPSGAPPVSYSSGGQPVATQGFPMIALNYTA